MFRSIGRLLTSPLLSPRRRAAHCLPTGRRCPAALIALCFHNAHAQQPAFRVPLTDLDAQAERQTVVDREEGQYLGHPATPLLKDGKTILCVYPKSHGSGALIYKRSTDGGTTWSDRLPTPKSWGSERRRHCITSWMRAAIHNSLQV